MKTIILNDLLKENNYVNSGFIVFNEAKDAVSNNETVILDMENVESVPTNFLNASLGSLMDIYGVEQTRRSFGFKNILKSQVERIKKYFNDYQTLLDNR